MGERTPSELPFNKNLLRKVDELKLGTLGQLLKNDNLVLSATWLKSADAAARISAAQILDEIKEIWPRWGFISAWKYKLAAQEFVEEFAEAPSTSHIVDKINAPSPSRPRLQPQIRP